MKTICLFLEVGKNAPNPVVGIELVALVGIGRDLVFEIRVIHAGSEDSHELAKRRVLFWNPDAVSIIGGVPFLDTKFACPWMVQNQRLEVRLHSGTDVMVSIFEDNGKESVF